MFRSLNVLFIFFVDLFFNLQPELYYNFSILGITLFELFCVITGIIILINNNPIISILFLIGLFLCISVKFFFINLNFIGLSYILVYVGAVTILFLFILMLINVRISEIKSWSKNSILLAIIASILFFSNVNRGLPYTLLKMKNMYPLYYFYYQPNECGFYNRNMQYENTILSKLGSISWEMSICYNTDIINLGQVLYTQYPMLIILTAIVLLLSMLGSIILTVKFENQNDNEK